MLSLREHFKGMAVTARARIHECREIAKSSRSTRRKVGALLTDEHDIELAIGFNDLPMFSKHHSLEDESGATRHEVIHAEHSILLQVGNMKKETLLYVTCAPCIHCAQLLLQHGACEQITFSETYRSLDGLKLLFEEHVELFFYDEFQESLYRVMKIEEDSFIGVLLSGRGTVTINKVPEQGNLVKALPTEEEHLECAMVHRR